MKYFSKHVVYNSTTHLIIGIGFGILAARPLAATHPLRWALVFLVVGLAMHVMVAMEKK